MKVPTAIVTYNRVKAYYSLAELGCASHCRHDWYCWNAHCSQSTLRRAPLRTRSTSFHHFIFVSASVSVLPVCCYYLFTLLTTHCINISNHTPIWLVVVIYIYTHTHTHTHIYIYIYLFILL